MFGKLRFLRWPVAAVMMAVLECLSLAAIQLAFAAPAQAQYYDDRYQRRQRQDYRGGGFFQQLFGPFIGQPDSDRKPNYYHPERRSRRSAPQHVDHSQAPPPDKPEEGVTPTTSIIVMGDGMADWLAYGLEEAFSDSPEVGIVREDKARSGLIRYDAHGDQDWAQVARDLLAKQKANYVVMMLGVSDRQNIREKDVKEPEQDKTDQAGVPAGDGTQSQNQDADAGEKAAAAPERKPKKANPIIEFRSDRWAEVYSRRIDETIAALKSKGVPVFWVGLPSIRGTKSTADAVYLNDLYRERAERAGIVYIDIWDGFVDESGKYSSYGPDYEGQTRRLRSADGVFFTKYGARKLAHYVEREIRRYMNNRALQVLLPSGSSGPLPNGNPAERPVVGPVLPLTAPLGTADVLAGAAGRQPASNAVATQVLVKGEAVTAPPGRADNFAWPLGSATVNDAGSKATAERVSTPPPNGQGQQPATTMP